MMIVLVSKQHKVTTKYKMQATPHFSLISQFGEDIIIQKSRASRFSAGRVPVEPIFETCLYTYREKVVRQNVVFISMHEAREKTLL